MCPVSGYNIMELGHWLILHLFIYLLDFMRKDFRENIIQKCMTSFNMLKKIHKKCNSFGQGLEYKFMINRLSQK